jgi:hypothetical protein
MFTRRAKPIRIIDDPYKQHTDKWSSTVLKLDGRSEIHTPAALSPGIKSPLPTDYGVG